MTLGVVLLPQPGSYTTDRPEAQPGASWLKRPRCS